MPDRARVARAGFREDELARSPGEANGPPPGACGVCGGPARWLVTFDGLEVERCRGCGCTQVARISGAPPALEQDAGYAERYLSEAAAAKAEACWSLLEKHVPGLPAHGRLADLGCGGGAFLDLARERGFATLGVDDAAPMVAETARRGHAVVRASVADAGLDAAGHFDLITLWDVAEHLREPGRAFRAAVAALAPGGWLVVVSPRMGSLYDRVALAAWRGTRGRSRTLLRMCWSRDHLFRFHPVGLARFLTGLGCAEVLARPVRLLSLRAHVYAGGSILPAWTPFAAANRFISRSAVRATGLLGITNKVLVAARAPLAPDFAAAPSQGRRASGREPGAGRP